MKTRSYSCCSVSSVNYQKLTKLSTLLRLVADESRLKLLCVLQDGEHCVCEIEKHLPLSQSLISHHLRDLKDAGIVSSDKRGLRAYYKLTPYGKKVTNMIFNLKKEVKI